MVKKFSSQQGALPVFFLLTALGLLLFLLIANTASFKDRLFYSLFPKQSSHAKETQTSKVYPDTTPPSLSITSPQDGSSVKINSKVNITASATDNVAVKRVEFYIDGNLKCSVISSSLLYSCAWSVTGKENTQNTVSAKAYDGAGNVSSASVMVTAK